MARGVPIGFRVGATTTTKRNIYSGPLIPMIDGGWMNSCGSCTICHHSPNAIIDAMRFREMKFTSTDAAGSALLHYIICCHLLLLQNRSVLSHLSLHCHRRLLIAETRLSSAFFFFFFFFLFFQDQPNESGICWLRPLNLICPSVCLSVCLSVVVQFCPDVLLFHER